ncbi:MAG: hypothetical protein HY821_05815 [Acidobacteria bacterium]|nr:hypothetical protein [Acidobacteriota bacterium]
MKHYGIIAALFLAQLGYAGEIIDRVAATAGQQIVTMSAVLRQMRLESLASGTPFRDTEENRRKAASRLVDQGIVLREIELSRYVQPTLAEAEAALELYLKDTRQEKGKFIEQVAIAGFTEDEFLRDLQWRLSVSRFVDYRFSAGVQVTEEEVQSYYQKEFAARQKAISPAAPLPPLEEVRERVLRIVTLTKTNSSMEQWLARMREQLGVRYFDKAFRVGVPER